MFVAAFSMAVIIGALAPPLAAPKVVYCKPRELPLVKDVISTLA